MAADLQEQIRELIEGGAPPVTLSEITGPPAGRRASAGADRWRRRPGRPVPLSAAAAGIVVLACAGALVAGQLGAPPTRGTGQSRNAGTIITAAMVRRVAAASRSALAYSGSARITYRGTQAGVVQEYGADDITFSGRNWNFAGHIVTPASAGQPASDESFINRVVGGQAYDYFVAADGLRWYHDIGPDAVGSLDIPDPRVLLRALQPGARFERAGQQMLGGLRVEQLRATDLQHLARLTHLPGVQPGERVTSLDVWADGSGVVRRMSLVFQGTVGIWTFHGSKQARAELVQIKRTRPAELRSAMRKLGAATERTEATQTDLTVSFLDIGGRQVITVPPHAVTVYGRG